MAYHLQMDGQTECVNQEVKQFLHLFVNQRQDDWDDWYDWLLIAKFAYKDWVHALTQASLFMLNAGMLVSTHDWDSNPSMNPNSSCWTTSHLEWPRQLTKHEPHWSRQPTTWPSFMMPTNSVAVTWLQKLWLRLNLKPWKPSSWSWAGQLGAQVTLEPWLCVKIWISPRNVNKK